MANELEGARTLPVIFLDQLDGTAAERVAVVGTVTAVMTGSTSAGTSSSNRRAGTDGAAVVAKAGAGSVYGLHLTNVSAATRYVKLWNRTTVPVLGTDAPLSVIAIPAGGSRDFDMTAGWRFSTGIAWAITTGAADLDIAVSLAGDVVGMLLFL